MSINHGTHPFDENKTREQLVSELAEIRKRLVAKEEPCYEPDRKHQTQEFKALPDSLFRPAVDQFPGFFVIYDARRRYLYVSSRVTQKSGLGAERFIGHRDEELIPPEICNQYLPYLNRVYETGKPQSLELKIPEKFNGGAFLVVKYVPVLDEHGAVGRVLGISTNITKLRLAEKARRDSEARTRSILEAAPVGIGVLSKQVFLDLNDRFCEITGYAKDEMLGQSSRMIYPTEKEYETAGREQSRQIRANGTAALETRFRCKDGRIVDVLLNSSALDPTDLSAGVTLTVLNITDRKRAVAILRESGERYRTLFKNNHAVLLLVDPLDGRIIDASSAACIFYGYPRDEITRIKITDIDTLPADQVRMELQAMGSMQGRHMSSKHRMADGRTCDVELFSGPVFLRGQTLLYAIIHDITERKKAEEALEKEKALLQAILQQMPAGVAIAEVPSGKILMVNGQLEQILGTTKTKSPSTARYGSSYQAFHADGTPYQSREIPLARSVLHGEIVVDEEMTLQRNDGTQGVISVSAEPVCDSQGNQVACVSLIRDVTEQKKLVQTLKKLNETLEHRVAERTALAESRAKQLQALAVELIEAEERERRRVAQLLHEDLQQTLAAIRYQVQALAQDSSSFNPTLAHIEGMLEESIGMSRRLSHELSPTVLHHAGLVAGLKWLFGQMKKQFGLEIQLEASAMTQFDNASVRVFLFRAVQELLFNAVKHAGVKSARVALSADDDGITVSVSDKGKGFDPETIYCTSEKPGLGLLTIKERANHIGGNLVIESNPGKGSRFTLTVPLDVAESDKTHTLGIIRKSCLPVQQRKTAEKIGVLFADDHKVMRKGLIKLVAEQQDIRVVGEAENGLEAVEITRDLRPDVVVMDISMPGMDGIEATRLIKAEMPQIRVIGLSMHDDEHVSKAMHEAGAEAFLSKTASSPELLRTIYGFKHDN